MSAPLTSSVVKGDFALPHWSSSAHLDIGTRPQLAVPHLAAFSFERTDQPTNKWTKKGLPPQTSKNVTRSTDK